MSDTRPWEEAFAHWWNTYKHTFAGVRLRTPTEDDIRHLRESFRVGFLDGANFRDNMTRAPDIDGLTEKEKDLCRKGKHIQAIKEIRTRLGITLLLAKRFYDAQREGLR